MQHNMDLNFSISFRGRSPFRTLLLHSCLVCSLPEDDIRSKYMTVPIKPPDVRPEDLYKLPKRGKKGEHPGDDAKR